MQNSNDSQQTSIDDQKKADAQSADGAKETSQAQAEPATPPQEEKFHLEFPYSELVKAQAPKAFEVAEKVAEEWVKDGSFQDIPVGHPLAQIALATGLRKAKDIEKKLEEKGVIAMAKMGIELAKSKLKK